ncbi:MAG: Beta-glucosidase A [Parcubacteria group bacterium GW2011_GWC1_43_11]|nr:MAG: Beta-glucosidase A [Parcubacteria group bacterium GW2011_GWC1_43_11]
MIDDMEKDLKFPEGFLWGTATSAHQVEGNNHNQWTEWEESPKRINYLKSKELNPADFISAGACDHYNHCEEDFDLAKAMNNNTHRFSIEWSRIEPQEGNFNQAEIEHYRKVIRALRARGIEPFITLWHWTMPIWFAEMGGFENRDNIIYFVRFCDRIVSELKNEVKYWIILNEPMRYAGMAYLAGEEPPQKKNPFVFLRVISNLAEAHNRVYEAIHRIDPNAQVGIAHQMNYYEGWPASFINWFWSKRFLKKIEKHFDFIGLNYYCRLLIKGFNFNAGKGQRIDVGWEIYPEGIYHVLKSLDRYQKPIYITENGLADSQDRWRAKFIIDHLRWIHKAISEGVDVRGYFHWSLLDNFEWAYGFWPKFGIIEVDRETLERKMRFSGKVYGEIARTGSITPEIIKIVEGGKNYD